MKIILISIAVILTLIVVFMALGILVNKHNMKKDKYDLLIYFTKIKINYLMLNKRTIGFADGNATT